MANSRGGSKAGGTGCCIDGVVEIDRMTARQADRQQDPAKRPGWKVECGHG